jgi:hypothetical protein
MLALAVREGLPANIVKGWKIVQGANSSQIVNIHKLENIDEYKHQAE